ncbi:DAK2 domain-containing protein [Sinomonas sp. JGH33]|uniref:DAK2 domain-containing protein n=1 Tax=Sinomonas terricola TaxID=3110330 RepID=A0ABU5TA80_9MICC|nr:DAK2 domain-containing protein [Sinomonas sp. JGH33]MEA5456579.1 DAK2 domain-containing protein [Sinomonas sp. JGH33]
MRRWLGMAETVLANHSDRLNAINIFPVPDGDTGTNLYLTARAAAEAAQECDSSDLGAVIGAAGHAAMEEARGNSGTLFAVFLDAFSVPLAGQSRLSGPLLAEALHRSQIRAWSALSEPVEGTMLSVLAAAADAAAGASSGPDGQHEASHSNAALAQTLDAVVEAALAAVVSTEGQLAMLHEARVVDAGAVGLLLVLGALRSAVLGVGLTDQLLDQLHGYRVEDPHIHETQPPAEGVELMCTITLSPLDAAGLRHRLDELGDSVIMSPLGPLDEDSGCVRWRVHVHVRDPETVLAEIKRRGEPERVSFTELHSDHAS